LNESASVGIVPEYVLLFIASAGYTPDPNTPPYQYTPELCHVSSVELQKKAFFVKHFLKNQILIIHNKNPFFLPDNAFFVILILKY
jgi:hypothetical protein